METSKVSSNIELVERYPGPTIAQSMSLDLALPVVSFEFDQNHV